MLVEIFDRWGLCIVRITCGTVAPIQRSDFYCRLSAAALLLLTLKVSNLNPPIKFDTRRLVAKKFAQLWNGRATVLLTTEDRDILPSTTGVSIGHGNEWGLSVSEAWIETSVHKLRVPLIETDTPWKSAAWYWDMWERCKSLLARPGIIRSDLMIRVESTKNVVWIRGLWWDLVKVIVFCQRW